MNKPLKATVFLAVLAALFTYLQPVVAQKTIKDPVEYNAYIAAFNLTDPKQKADAMDAFVNQYPNSAVKIDAMEQAMAAYQQLGNAIKVEDIANRILQIDKDNLRALAIRIFLERARATSGDKKAMELLVLDRAAGLLKLPEFKKPEGTSDADFLSVYKQAASIIYGASGFVYLQDKKYADARDYYLKSLAVIPDNLQDAYQLSIAQLQMIPIDPDGFWYLARAINLTRSQKNAAGEQSMQSYGRAVYKNYHGGDDGWDNIVASAANGAAPPTGFAASIKRGPTPAEIAVQAVKENDPASLSFSDQEFILSYRDASPENKQAADRIWQAIQTLQKNGAAKLKIPVKVISSDSNTIRAAISEDNQKQNIADLEVTMQTPMQKPPQAGAEVNIIGILTDYKTKPFTFVMKNGEFQ